jgi:hypothetical protein
MARRKTKKTHMSRSENMLIGFVMFLLILGTLAVITTQDPEHINKTSEDGLFHIEGTVLGSAAVGIQQRDDLAQVIKGAYGTVYQVSVSEPGWFPFADISYRVGEELIDQVSLYHYDDQWLAWIEADFLQSSLDSFYLEDVRLSDQTLWVLRTKTEDSISERAAVVLDELIAFSVPNAVAYKAVVAKAVQSVEFVVVEEEYNKGGCEGVYTETSSSTITSHEYVVDDAIERITVRWYLAEGCAEGEEIESS